MWPSIKLWRDWVMNDLLGSHRLRLPHEALHVSADVGGLILAGQPVPWYADAVLIEASLRLPAIARLREDFALRVPGFEPVVPHSFRRDEVTQRHQVFFRIVPPLATTTAELTWRDKFLGKVEIAILSPDAFLDTLRMQLPTVHVRLGTETVACQTFAASQCQGLSASGLLTSPTSLVPLSVLGLSAEFRREAFPDAYEVSVPLVGSQLTARQAIVAASPKSIARRNGTWTITWKAGGRVLATSKARAIGRPTLSKSLRVLGTRFVVEEKGRFSVRRQVPAVSEDVRVGPCFLVASSEPGLAAWCDFDVVMHGTIKSVRVLVTDTPSPVVPGTFAAADLSGVNSFDLFYRGKSLATLPLHSAPAAKFTAEGGFVPPSDFNWSPAADEELQERLAKLMGG